MSDDEPIELEPVDELELFEPDQSILEISGVAETIRKFARSSFPCCVLDTGLRIAWTNKRFSEHFPPATEMNAHLTSYFLGSFEEGKRNELLDQLRSSDSGYSWRGRIELSDPDRARIIADLLIGPVGTVEIGPVAYLAIVDDVSDQQRDLIRGTFSSLLEASLLKDNDTGLHIGRLNEYCRILAERAGTSERFQEVDFEFIDTISFVAAMHDVGKIGTPDDILNKDGPLEDWQWDVMREHTINGAYILSTYPAPMAKEIALFHHEWWDGTGYRYGISGDMIPLSARIVTLADVYDALRMKRPYKPAFSHDDSCEEIRTGIGTHFDPTLAGLFLENAASMNDIFEKFHDEEPADQ